MSHPPRNEESFKDAQNEEDALADALTRGSVPVVGMDKMSEKLAQMQIESKREWADEEEEDDGEIDALLNEVTPVLPSEDKFHTPQNNKDSERPPTAESHVDEDIYAESFASQRETAQLREEVEEMSNQVRILKDSIAGLLKEREAIPVHLSTIKEDINQQMTLMLSKLYSMQEVNASTSNIKAASTAVQDAKERSVDRLTAAEDYAKDEPRDSSPLANKGIDLKGKRRFRPIK